MFLNKEQEEDQMIRSPVLLHYLLNLLLCVTKSCWEVKKNWKKKKELNFSANPNTSDHKKSSLHSSS